MPNEEIIGCHESNGTNFLQRITWDFLFPKTWDKLQETENSKIRFCKSCGQNVHLVTTFQEFEEVSDVRCCISARAGSMVMTGSHRSRG